MTKPLAGLFVDFGPGCAGILNAPEATYEVGGLLLAEEPRAHGGPFALLYSRDLDVSARAILESGGTILQEAYRFPGGRRLHFADPSGNELGVWATQ